jgi:hypothetical protein
LQGKTLSYDPDRDGDGMGDRAVRCDTDHATPYPVGPTAIGNLLPIDRPWHLAKTKGELTVTVDHNGSVTMTTVSGQTRTVTPYDHRMTEPDPSMDTQGWTHKRTTDSPRSSVTRIARSHGSCAPE